MLSLRSLPSSAALAGALLSAALLAGCGGGGNELGPGEEIFASPNAVTVSAAGSCMVGLGPTVHVYGGLPPYRLKNSVPQGMVLDRNTVNHSGEAFTITFIDGVCMSDMPITIEDGMGRLTVVSVTNQPI